MMTAVQIEEDLIDCASCNFIGIPMLDEPSRKLLAEIIEIASVIAFDKMDKFIWGKAKRGKDNVFFCIKLRYDDLLFVGGVCIGALKTVEKGNENMVPLLEWVKEEVVKTIKMLKEDTYHEKILQKLPISNRSGVIKLKDYWKYVPQDYAKELEALDIAETEEFIKWVNANEAQDIGYDEMTPNQFYDACMFIFQFQGYNVENMTPKEAYLRYGDGRDCGFTKLKDDSAEEFRNWYGCNGFGDHTDELDCGGILFRIVQSKNGKFAFYLMRVNHRDKDLIHVLLAMIKAGFLFDASLYSQMRNRFTGNCFIGISPYGGEFDYMQALYSKKRRIEVKCRTLPADAPSELIDAIDWLEPRTCELAEEVNVDMKREV